MRFPFSLPLECHVLTTCHASDRTGCFCVRGEECTGDRASFHCAPLHRRCLPATDLCRLTAPLSLDVLLAGQAPEPLWSKRAEASAMHGKQKEARRAHEKTMEASRLCRRRQFEMVHYHLHSVRTDGLGLGKRSSAFVCASRQLLILAHTHGPLALPRPHSLTTSKWSTADAIRLPPRHSMSPRRRAW